jgi:hypothetical protein
MNNNNNLRQEIKNAYEIVARKAEEKNRIRFLGIDRSTNLK